MMQDSNELYYYAVYGVILLVTFMVLKSPKKK